MIKLANKEDGIAVFDYDNATIIYFTISNQKISITFNNVENQDYKNRVKAFIVIDNKVGKFENEVNVFYDELFEVMRKKSFELNAPEAGYFPLMQKNYDSATLYQPTDDENLMGTMFGLKKTPKEFNILLYSSINDSSKATILLDSELDRLNSFNVFKRFVENVMKLPIETYENVSEDFYNYLNHKEETIKSKQYKI